MMARLREWWYQATGTDAQPVPPAPSPVRTGWTLEQAERYQATIRRQLQYVDTELAALRRVVERGNRSDGDR